MKLDVQRLPHAEQDFVAGRPHDHTVEPNAVMKHAFEVAVARGLAETLVGTNVTVNSVLPGPTSSEGVGTFVADLAKSQGKDVATVEREFFQSARPSSIIQRFGTPAEVASLVAYVCSTAASATTGAALRVDGGVVRAIA